MEALTFALHQNLDGMKFHGTEHEIAEATAIAVANLSIPVSTLVTLATTILVKRDGKDRAATWAAVKRRIGRRTEHDDPSFFPSHKPNPVAQAARMAFVHSSGSVTDTPDADQA